MLELDKVDRAQLAEFVGQDFEIALKAGAASKPAFRYGLKRKDLELV